MPQFRPLPSFQHDAVVDVIEEQSSEMSFTPPSTTQPLTNFPYQIQPLQPLQPLQPSQPFTTTDQIQQLPTTDQLFPVSQSLQYNSSSQSFISLSPSLIQPLQIAVPKKTDQLVVIPGSRKRTVVLPETNTPTRRMRKRVRHGIALGTVLFVLAITLLSLAPLDDGHSTFHVLGSVIQWADIQQQNWNIAAHTVSSGTAGTQSNTTTTTQGNTVSGSAPAINLPTSQYVAIAQQDAIDAGIPPDYFVRQIYAESSFNPNAYSPAGAVGIAQFEPSTAAGLGIDPYDPIQALRAAAKLMASYSNEYGGDYAKALAAYNAGSGNVANAVNSCGANWLSCLPAETQNYVYKIMGV